VDTRSPVPSPIIIPRLSVHANYESPLTFRSAIRVRFRFRTGVGVFGYLSPSRGSVAGNSLFGRSQTTL
jgi:hypothetical protein